MAKIKSLISSNYKKAHYVLTKDGNQVCAIISADIGEDIFKKVSEAISDEVCQDQSIITLHCPSLTKDGTTMESDCFTLDIIAAVNEGDEDEEYDVHFELVRTEMY